MAAIYKHGTASEWAKSIGKAVTLCGTVAVYVGAAPVNLVRGFEKYVNAPVKLCTMEAAQRYFGYSEDWASFDLCEAFNTNLDNKDGNAGPIVVINVLDPAIHKKEAETTKALTFVNGRAVFESDTIILDSLVLADKVEGVDFTIDYDFTKGQVIIGSIGDAITGSVNATFDEVDVTALDEDDIIGGVTSNGVYTGLGCIGLVYQELNLIPNLIVCPGWSEKPAVYEAMVKAGTKINGHWDAFALADIPVVDGASKVDTIESAIQWAKTNSYDNERTKAFWPQGMDAMGRVRHAAVMAAWVMMLVDYANNGIPMETPSNKAVPIVRQYFGPASANRGFDQERGNELNAAGITTLVYWGGRWVLWGPHTAAYKFGAVTDNRNIFDNSIRMMMHVGNSFQQDHALEIDKPMTRAMKDTILNAEREKMDALGAQGAFIGKAVVEFRESENSTDDLIEGNFVWAFEATPTPPFKSGTLREAYTTAGFYTYFGEVE